MNFEELRIEKERLKTRILKEERELAGLASDLRSGLSFSGIKNGIIGKIVKQPEMVIRTGILTYNIVKTLKSRKS